MSHESPPTRYECPDCDWCGIQHDMNAIRRIHERVLPGEFMAAGECPDCGALISVADEDIPDHALESAIGLAVVRDLLSNTDFAKMTLALGIVADVPEHKLTVLSPDQLRNLVRELRSTAADALPPIRAKGMTLVRSADKRPVHVGDRIEGFREMYVIRGGEPPRHSSSSGRVHTDQGVYFPSVVSCEWLADEH